MDYWAQSDLPTFPHMQVSDVDTQGYFQVLRSLLPMLYSEAGVNLAQELNTLKFPYRPTNRQTAMATSGWDAVLGKRKLTKCGNLFILYHLPKACEAHMTVANIQLAPGKHGGLIMEEE